jgi:hypothetical protein
LQLEAGDKPFYLSCRVAASLIGVGHAMAARWLKALCMDELLQLVELGRLRRASQYVYRGD